MPAPLSSRRSAFLGALAAAASGCLVTLDEPVFVTSLDAPTRDASDTDAMDQAMDAAGAEALDASVDQVRVDATATDRVVPSDRAIDATHIDVVTSRDASTGDAINGFVGPAFVSCGVATPSPPIATFVGNTCDGMDLDTLSCNSGAHHEVVIRIDGLAGQIWDVVPSAGLAHGLFLGTSCGNSPLVCSSGSPDGGGMITDGPFPAARTDYFVFEAMSPATCVAYSITVTQH